MRVTSRVVVSLLAALLVVTTVALATLGATVRAAAERGARDPRAAQAELSDARLEIALQRDLLLAALAGAAAIVPIAWLFRRAVARPLHELDAGANALATGDAARLPLDAPGEVGDAARGVARLGEQAGARFRARHVESELLGALGQSLTEAIVAIDARQSVVYVNDPARTLLRLPLALPFSAAVLPREPELWDALRDGLAGRAAGPVELVLGDRVLALTTRPIAAGAGVVLTFFDLTPIRRVEAMRRDFVANVSHELKTPLTIVGGFAETLADDDIPAAERRRFAETIRVNAWRMQRIVDDLLDLSRIESGGWRPRPARVDVAPAAEEASLAAGEAARAKGVAFVVDVAADAATVWADATAVRQVVSNLVENAVRHTAAGEVAVVARRGAHRGVDGVWLGVRDTGSGIPAQHLPRIFERFYRADPGRSREAGGTGLGLAIVKHLAEAHGGEVRAASVEGSGTTIEVFFPNAES